MSVTFYSLALERTDVLAVAEVSSDGLLWSASTTSLVCGAGAGAQERLQTNIQSGKVSGGRVSVGR